MTSSPVAHGRARATARRHPQPDPDGTGPPARVPLADGGEGPSLPQAHAEASAPAWTPLEEQVPADLLRAEVAAWARRIGVTPREVRIRPMRRKWASCSAEGRLTFDSALLRQPAHVRAEVIVHELLHIKLPNHGRLFRALLRAYLGAIMDPPSLDSSDVPPPAS